MESEEVGKAALQIKVKKNDPRITLTELSDKSEVLKKFLRVETDGVKSSYAACKTCKLLVKYTQGVTQGRVAFRGTTVNLAAKGSPQSPLLCGVKCQQR